MSLSRPDFFLTIIIPTFNSGKTLAIALASIAEQTYKNIEVLIVDGLSTDNTLAIAESFKKKINNLKIISEKDDGIYDAMNKGVTKANGNWIYFMGSDDSFYTETVVEEISKFNESLNSDVIYGDVFSTRFDGVYDGKFTYDKIMNKNICHQAIFFKKDIFKKTGNFNLRYKAHADWDHNIKWFFNKKIKQKYIDVIIANYADGGFSSLHGDEVFKKEKLQLIFKRGLFVLPTNKVLELGKTIVYDFLKN